MSALPQHFYRFATRDQWNAGLFERVDRAALDAASKVAPFMPYALPARRIATAGASAPAAGPEGEELWHDGIGHLYFLLEGDEIPLTLPAPAAIATAARIVVTRTSLWVVASAPDSLQCFDRAHLTSRFVVQLPQGQVLDLASDGVDGVWALTEAGPEWHCVHVDCAGVIREDFALQGTSQPTQLIFLHRFTASLYWSARVRNCAGLNRVSAPRNYGSRSIRSAPVLLQRRLAVINAHV